MPLGAAKWAKCRSFYDQLTLADGDLHEARAHSRHRLGTSFPSYTRFWKFHVCPATIRPHGITLRSNLTSAITSTIIQRSHAVLKDLAVAFDDLETVRAGNLGLDERNAEQVLLFSGNALQKAYDLAAAISPLKAGDFQGQPPLASQLGITLVPFPDWAASWADDRTGTATYRHYLTHQGGMFKVHKRGKVFVPSRKRFDKRQAITWTQLEQDYDHDPTDWVEIVSACEEVVKETIAFLDLFYERLSAALDPLLIDPTYQHLWGWRPNIDPLAAPRPDGRGMTGLLRERNDGGIMFHGSTATRVEDYRPVRPNDGPDPSGVQRF